MELFAVYYYGILQLPLLSVHTVHTSSDIIFSGRKSVRYWSYKKLSCWKLISQRKIFLMWFFLRGPHFCRLLCDADKTIKRDSISIEQKQWKINAKVVVIGSEWNWYKTYTWQIRAKQWKIRVYISTHGTFISIARTCLFIDYTISLGEGLCGK